MAEEKQYPKVPDEITVYYQKAKDHRTVRADGAWAGLTPALEIQFALYNDLQPMPKSVRHKVTERGLGPEVSREVDTAIVREAGVTVVMNVFIAMQFVNLLEQVIAQARAGLKSAMEQPDTQADTDTKTPEAS